MEAKKDGNRNKKNRIALNVEHKNSIRMKSIALNVPINIDFISL